MKTETLAFLICALFLHEINAEEQVAQSVEQKETVAKRDEVFYNNVGSVKNSYRVSGARRRSAEDQDNQANRATSTNSELLYYGPFYPRDFEGREYELYYPENPSYEEWYGPFEPPEYYYESGEESWDGQDYKRSLDFNGPRGGRSVYYGPRGGRYVSYGPRGGRSVENYNGPRGGRSVENDNGPRGGRSLENGSGPRGGRSAEDKSVTLNTNTGPRGGRAVKNDGPRGGRAVEGSQTKSPRENA